jgi:hypothetical protein
MISAFGTLPSEVLFAVFEARDKNPSTESGACAKCKRFLCQNCVPYPLEPGQTPWFTGLVGDEG